MSRCASRARSLGESFRALDSRSRVGFAMREGYHEREVSHPTELPWAVAWMPKLGFSSVAPLYSALKYLKRIGTRCGIGRRRLESLGGSVRPLLAAGRQQFFD